MPSLSHIWQILYICNCRCLNTLWPILYLRLQSPLKSWLPFSLLESREQKLELKQEASFVVGLGFNAWIEVPAKCK